MKKLKYIILFVFMVSNGAGAFTSLLGFQGTVLEYNAYFQALIALGIFLWLSHKVLQWGENRHSKPVVNARDKK